jgi:acyl carrier protein
MIEKEIIEIIQQTAGSNKEIKPTDKLLEDLGLDSLDSVEIIMSIEQKYDITIQDDKISNIHTVGDIIELAKKMCKSSN